MSLDHSNNAIPAIQREHHWHQGDDETKPGYARVEQTLYQSYILTSGGYVYICESVVGTPLASAKWRIVRIDESTGSSMYADANTKFDNVASDPTSLTYSYS